MKNNPTYRGLLTLCRLLTCTILTAVAFSSCESFVDIDAPSEQLQGATVYEDAGTATAALTAIYSALQRNTLVSGGSNGLSILMGSYADELTSYSNYGLPEEVFFTNNLQPDDQAVLALWSESYSLIYASNAVIEGVENSTNITQPDKEILVGEALFVRSYIHFYLMQLFGDVPYVTQTNYRINSTISKTDAVTLYSLLATDLVQAIALLPANYADPLRVRPNRSVANALLARVYLYSGAYGDAADAAAQVISNSELYSMASNLEEVFLISSPSTLWQLMPPSGNMNTLEGQHFIFNSGPPPARALSPSLYNAFEPGDLRRQHWVGTVSDGADNWHYPFKYRQSSTTGASQEYSVQFRLEEMYLIRAEALAWMGNLDGARQDLNAIRNRAGLGNTPIADTDGLLEAILKERRVEFFTEHGHRFFDLKRTNQLDAHLAGTKPGWNATDSSLPLPQIELSLNSNLLPQNPGY